MDQALVSILGTFSNIFCSFSFFNQHIDPRRGDGPSKRLHLYTDGAVVQLFKHRHGWSVIGSTKKSNTAEKKPSCPWADWLVNVIDVNWANSHCCCSHGSLSLPETVKTQKVQNPQAGRDMALYFINTGTWLLISSGHISKLTAVRY